MAEFYLRAERGVEDLFAERRSNAGVLFASIPNFTEFYSEDVNEGVECIRLLNEIIIDFDEILDDEKFVSVEKIKTVGSTYMAASGITPSSDKVKYFLQNTYLYLFVHYQRNICIVNNCSFLKDKMKLYPELEAFRNNSFLLKSL